MTKIVIIIPRRQFYCIFKGKLCVLALFRYWHRGALEMWTSSLCFSSAKTNQLKAHLVARRQDLNELFP